MGIRMAVGATSQQLRALVVREVLLPVGVGAVAGVAGALATGRYIQHLVVHAEPVTWEMCLAGAALLLGVAGSVAWRATAQVVSIDPAEAIRVD